MPNWSPAYTKQAESTVQKPRYVLMIAHDEVTQATALTDTLTYAEVDVDEDLDIYVPGPVLFFDKDNWELATVTEWDPDYSAPLGRMQITRGQYNTYAWPFAISTTLIAPEVWFSTHAIDDADGLLIKEGYMSMPSGVGQSLDFVNGRLQTDDLNVDIHDHNNDVTRLLRANPLIGKKAVLFGGYDGMPFHDYSFLYAGKIASAEIRDGGIYNFQFEHIITKLTNKLFQFVGDYRGSLTSDMTIDGTAFPANSDLLPSYVGPDEVGEEPLDSATKRLAIYHALIDSEDCPIIINSGGTLTIVRGYFNTTAATHTQGTAIDLIYAIEDNPIDILISLIITQVVDHSYPTNTDAQGYNYNRLYGGDENFGNIGLALPVSEIDLDSFEDIRDNWYADYVWRLKISKGEQIKPFLEKYIMKTLGLCPYINRAGQLALAIDRPPIQGATIEELTEDDIIGAPPILFDNTEIINEVKIDYDYDPIDNEFDAVPITVVDETSQVTYDMHGVIELEARGLDSNRRGLSLAPRICRKKYRNYKDANPKISLEVLFNHANLEPGEVVQVNHATLPDIRTGSIGWDKKMVITGKRVRWDRGTLELDVVDTAYHGKRYCLIAPSGTDDYSSASDEVKAVYGFASDTNDEMSDGTAGYQVM
jgi:hypothetical protein